MKINEIIQPLEEGINDKGIFKACFVSGLPGAGKSTIINKINGSDISARIVNTDRGYEFLLKKHGLGADQTAWQLLGEPAMRVNKNALLQYLNGMLPMFIDGTSANSSSLLRRNGILNSIGYDTMMLWINIDLETAISRVQQRERKVPEDFIKEVYHQLNSNKSYYQSYFGDRFIEVDNSGDNFSAYENKAYSIMQRFYYGEILNPIGVKTVENLQDSGQKTLIPTIMKKEYLDSLISVWYQK